MAAETGFIIDGTTYEIPSLDTLTMDEAQVLCDRVAIVDQGRIIALGTPVELIASLGAEHVVDFALACALAGDPDLLFLDEPTTGLDPQSRRQLWDLLAHYKQRGRTVVITTHYRVVLKEEAFLQHRFGDAAFDLEHKGHQADHHQHENCVDHK